MNYLLDKKIDSNIITKLNLKLKIAAKNLNNLEKYKTIYKSSDKMENKITKLYMSSNNMKEKEYEFLNEITNKKFEIENYPMKFMQQNKLLDHPDYYAFRKSKYEMDLSNNQFFPNKKFFEIKNDGEKHFNNLHKEKNEIYNFSLFKVKI